MGKRKAAFSETVEYETAECVHCEDEVFIDTDASNIDGLPMGVTVTIGGGKHLSVETTSLSARAKDHRIPRIVTKWFAHNNGENKIEQQHMCLACAEAVYGFSLQTHD